MASSRDSDTGADQAAPMIPRAWLFDFDRTLAILEPEVDWAAGRRALEVELASAGTPPDLLAELIAIHPRGNLVLYEALRARLFDQDSPLLDEPRARTIIERASTLIERYEMAGVDRAAPMAGAADLLARLARRHIPIAIVTSNSSATVRRWLEINRLGDIVAEANPEIVANTGAHTIPTIVGRDAGLAVKPSPATVIRALELLRAGPADAVFIGDSVSDFEAARAASVRFCAIAPELAASARLAILGATEIFSSPNEVSAHFGLSR